jgi:hypothetical protein
MVLFGLFLQFEFVDYSWKKLALFLEERKFVRQLIVSQDTTRVIFQPESNIKFLISGYMTIDDFAGIVCIHIELI